MPKRCDCFASLGKNTVGLFSLQLIVFG